MGCHPKLAGVKSLSGEWPSRALLKLGQHVWREWSVKTFLICSLKPIILDVQDHWPQMLYCTLLYSAICCTKNYFYFDILGIYSSYCRVLVQLLTNFIVLSWVKALILVALFFSLLKLGSNLFCFFCWQFV